ncbi:MAG: hypothetical protein P0Y49_10935 [Candidatus Pedobacter colombiensis]|uniref:Uncharacterized protein n=1 Tax=Candidatus Pedobacter colombiensis TaxID=3121371 RepID=A0AAJ5WBN2_9SPHI|nr:hypothetical protein [Pedobacter sp.]WEK21651.1 MAG: hypothetical protein P0Y49_10935 [Pedobacter sp.]
MVENYPLQNGVGGSNFARKYISDKIDLASGADLNEEKTEIGLYWINPTGIFGQYYNGVVREFGLISPPSGKISVYTITTSGKALADAFNVEIGEKTATLFLQILEKGNLDRTTLKELQPFSLNHISFNSAEQCIYQNLLLGPDSMMHSVNSFHRRETILLLLEHLRNSPQRQAQITLDFLRKNNNKVLSRGQIETDASTFWCFYELSELFHISMEHFHGCFLQNIDHEPQAIQEVINQIMHDVEESFIKEDISIEETNLKELLVKKHQSDLSTHEHNLETINAFRNRATGSCLKHAVYTMIGVYRDIFYLKDQIAEIIKLPEFRFDRTGNLLLLMTQHIESNKQIKLKDFFVKTLHTVINMHTYSSYAKSRIGMGIPHNYMIEENMVWKLKDTFPGRTSPRLQNTIQFLIDIDWLNNENKDISINERGLEILERYGK